MSLFDVMAFTRDGGFGAGLRNRMHAIPELKINDRQRFEE